MSLLVKFDITQHTECHEEDQSRIEEDQTSLTNVGVIEEDEAGREDAGRERVTRLPHNEEDGRHGECSKERRQSSERHVWYLVLNVGVADVIEEEVAIITD